MRIANKEENDIVEQAVVDASRAVADIVASVPPRLMPSTLIYIACKVFASIAITSDCTPDALMVRVAPVMQSVYRALGGAEAETIDPKDLN